jgi:hypothetical protein
LPPGRNEALFSVRGPAGRNKERTESGGRTRAPAAFVVGDGLCALELYDAHIRRIAAVAMPHGNRTIPRRVLYVPGGGTEPVVIPVCVGRWHIRGDAVIGGSRDGKLTGRVRVFAENARGKRYPAEILLGFADNTANGAALYGGKNDNKRTD